MTTAGGLAAATLAFALYTLLRFFWAPLAPGLPALAMLGVVAACTAPAGRRVCRALGLAESEAGVPGAALGLGLLALGLFALAAAHALSTVSAAILLGALAAAGATERRGWKAPFAEAPAAAKAGLWLLAGVLALFALVPPHQYDSLVYHLTLPEAYARAGGFTWPRQLVYSHFPQNAELLFTLGALWKSELFSQLLMSYAALLTAAWLFEALREDGRPGAGALAALLLLSQTAVMLLSSTSYNEPLVMLWTTGALLCFAKDKLDLAAVFAGLALGAKYYAGVPAAALTLILAGRGRAGAALRFALVAAAVWSPWLVKNALVVGNPVFPFLYKLFPMTNTGWTAQTAAGYFEVFTEYGHRKGVLLDLLNLPGLLLVNGASVGGGMDVLGNYGWDLLFWCLPLAVWTGRKEKLARLALVFSGLYLAGWYLTGIVLRFLVALAPALCLLAARGLSGLWEKLSAPGRKALAAAVGALGAAHLLLFFFVHGVFGSGRYLTALESREEFLSRLEYYPCARAAAGRLPQNDKILIVGEQRGYYVEQEAVATTVHGPNPYVDWANESKDAKALKDKLRSEGFSHLLVVPSEFRRLAPAIGDFSEKGAANWKGLEKELKTVFEAPGCGLFSLP
jgi:hypothetical protein